MPYRDVNPGSEQPFDGFLYLFLLLSTRILFCKTYLYRLKIDTKKHKTDDKNFFDSFHRLQSTL